ncbi:hypothetical protein PINS_up014991 [Pythium insidiosum]|nr:hypothetical protein PINS_up014991 [Pythium insidiosum]
MLPRATIEKYLRDVIPEDLTVQKETLEWVTESAAEFVRTLGERANAVAAADAKSEKYRISREHVIAALLEMEMGNYVDAINRGEAETAAATELKKKRQASKKAALQGASHEELLAEQNALFRSASLKAARDGW